MAVASHVGTPGISDTGYHIVREALGRGVQAVAVP